MVSHMPNDCEPTAGAWSCHVGHWYVPPVVKEHLLTVALLNVAPPPKRMK